MEERSATLFLFVVLGLLRYLFVRGEEFEGRGIKTISLAGWRWAVGEDVALVAAAAGAADLDAAHTVAIVFDIGEMVFVERRVERRPAGAGMKF